MKPDLQDFFVPENQNGFLSFSLSNWKKEDVQEIFLFDNGVENRGSYKFIEAAQNIGFTVTKIPVELIKENDNYLHDKLNYFAKERLSKRSAVFLYKKSDELFVLNYTAILITFLNRFGKFASPENVIRYIQMRNNLRRSDLPVFQYKRYIDHSYKIPKPLLKFFSSTDTDDFTDTEGGIIEFNPDIELPDKKRKLKKEDREKKSVSPEIESIDAELNKPRGKGEVIPDEFKTARFFTIRNKLLLIISGIILLALSGMIFLASYFFKEDSEIRINEFSLSKTELFGQNIESELRSLSFLNLNAASSLMQKTENEATRNNIVKLFFDNNKDVAFLGVAKDIGGKISFVQSIANEKFLDENNFPVERLEQIPHLHSEIFLRAMTGVPVIINVSTGLPIPLLGMGLLFGSGAEQYLVIALINPSKFMSVIQSRGIIKTFIVDSQGKVIVHEKGEFVLSGKDMSEMPIVKKMLQSKSDNENIHFEDETGEHFIGIFKKLSFGGLAIISTVNEDLAFQAVYQIQKRNILILGIILLSAILIVFFFARTLTVPLKFLVRAAERVKEGDYDIKIFPTTHDEIGSLTHTFSKMAVGLSEREKMKDAFGKFVNKHVAEQVLSGKVALGGVKKDCAVFFSDLRGFTAMSEKMSPEGVVEYLNEYFQDMVQCVNDTHGVVDKYIGDAIMAHWGALESIGNDTENAINAGILMRKALLQFNKKASSNRPFAKFGCGINTGPVISGQIGSTERLEYTIIGDAVNLASRIEQLNKPFGTDILISQDSYDRVKGIFNVEKMPPIKVKGKSEAQTIYAVLGRSDDPECPSSMIEVRNICGIDPPTVDLANFSDSKEEKFEVL